MGGGNPFSALPKPPPGGLSPRGRGKRGKKKDGKAAWRSIPAWAGETVKSVLNAPLPRGLSPRGRGKRPSKGFGHNRQRSIPAWAGETFAGQGLGAGGGVYPRVGGGNMNTQMIQPRSCGLSPRGRGKPLPAAMSDVGQRSIPAWAGETNSISKTAGPSRVYPRVGGGNPGRQFRRGGVQGLSPRGRGKRPGCDLTMAATGSIPAWAGETAAPARRPLIDGVYPRVGGGNPGRSFHSPSPLGLSPRGRGKPFRQHRLPAPPGSIPAWAGETAIIARHWSVSMVYPRVGGGNRGHRRPGHYPGGLSPRGRGKPFQAMLLPTDQGSIPAWAGETPTGGAADYFCTVYPRVGGGNLDGRMPMLDAIGLSPRGRGKQFGKLVKLVFRGSIPAWAGETGREESPARQEEVYPRVGGGNRTGGTAAENCAGLSPRGRGKLLGYGRPYRERRSIPAWAGETLAPAFPPSGPEVYPRVGGGNDPSGAVPLAVSGLSPRGRGKRAEIVSDVGGGRSIPAWAGETRST